MKKLSLLFAFCLGILTSTHAQIPPKAFNYSAVARNAAGQPIASATIGIQISILQSSSIGSVMYSENHFVNTDAYGLFNLIVGAGAVQSGNMSSIDWSIDDYYLKVGMDANGGTNFLTMGTTQLLSVPYALHAATADSIAGVQLDGSETVIIAGNDVVITGSGTATDPYVVNANGAAPGAVPTLVTGTVQEYIGAFGTPDNFVLSLDHTVSSDGGETILGRGVCYGTSPNPTTSGSVVGFIGNYGLVGTANSDIYTIQPNTTYFMRAYAVNVKGTAYGNEVSFTTANIQLPTLTTDNVTFNDFQPDGSVQAVFSGQLLNDGGQAPITGFCYSTSPNPTVNDNVLNSYLVLSTTGTLLPNTTYYVRAYATNVAGTSYGNQVTYTTPAVQLATVVTNPVGSLNPAPGPSYYTYFYGQLTNNGGTIFTQWGYCYSTSPNPTINDILISDGQPAYGLSVGQTYYVRAYATNSAGTSYGNEITFSTPAITIPVVATYPATDIFSEFATFNGELIDDGADNWGGFSSGFCYSTSPNPTINDAVIYVYAAVPSPLMQTPVMDLLPNTTYYVRAFGQNSVGTGYGNEVNFTTLP